MTPCQVDNLIRICHCSDINPIDDITDREGEFGLNNHSGGYILPTTPLYPYTPLPPTYPPSPSYHFGGSKRGDNTFEKAYD